MAPRRNKYSVVAIIFLLLAFLFVKCFRNREQPKPGGEAKEIPEYKKDNRNARSAWRYQPLEYTQHARCRMACRQITAEEVEHVLRNGTVNYKKSDVKDKPCPTYALESRTYDGQEVRIVFAGCPGTTKVITCIDLGEEHPCDCN